MGRFRNLKLQDRREKVSPHSELGWSRVGQPWEPTEVTLTRGDTAQELSDSPSEADGRQA